MALYRITDEDLEGKGVIPLADIPGLPAEDMKAKFEQLVTDVIVPKYNETIDTLNALLYFDEHGNAYLTTQNLIVSYNALRHALDPEKVPNGISVRDMDVALRALITSLSNDVEALKGLGLDPKVAATVADMTDHDKIYVYVGSETGYVANDWYYWNGTAWTDGGVFNATALVTDTSLTQSGLAADAKVTGDKITATRVMIAPAYSISGVYAKDDIVTYGEKIYKAKQAISAEDWTAAHWQEINIGAFIPRLDTTLNTAGKAADAKATGDAIVGLDARITSNSGEIMSLKTRMLTAEADIDSLETRITTAESDIDSLEGRMYTAESDIDSLEERMTTAELDITSLKSRVTLTEGEISAAEAMIAPDYSTSASYSKGDFVVYRNPASVYGKLYKAKQNISAESWNASHWDEVNIGASIPRLDTTLTQAGKAADAKATGNAIKKLKDTLGEDTYNKIDLLTQTVVVNNVTVTSKHNDCSITLYGTANNSGDYGTAFAEMTLPAGTYYRQVFGKTGNYRVMCSVNDGAKVVFYGIFTLPSESVVKIYIQVINGNSYDETIYLQIVEGTQGKSFLTNTTAKDQIARPLAESNEERIENLETVVPNKLEQEYFFGINRVLPRNMGYGEGTSNPLIMRVSSETGHYLGVRVVENNTTPFKNLFQYIHEVYKENDQTGWLATQQYAINNMFKEGMTSLCFGFWCKVSEINSVFGDNDKFTLQLFGDSTHRVSFGLLIKTIIANVGHSYSVTADINRNTFDSYSAEVVCLTKINDWAYVRLYVSEIVFVTGFPYSTLATNSKLYFNFDWLASTLKDHKVSFGGFTILQDYLIESYAYRYPDVSGVYQLPPYKSVIDTIQEETVSDSMVVIYDEGAEEDVRIQTYVGTDLIENTIMALTDDPSYNKTSRPLRCILKRDGVSRDLQKSEDDGCPLNLTSGYIGGGHGYNRAVNLAFESNHDKTYADIGSKWADENNKNFYIVAIIDDTHIGVLTEQEDQSNGYDLASGVPSGELVHVSGAVNTSSMDSYTANVYQIEPVAMDGMVKKVVIDGVTEVSDSGTYYAKKYVDIINEYDVVNPRTIVSGILENKPVGGYTSNPVPNKGSRLFHVSNVYRYLPDGTMLLISTLDNDLDLVLGYWGATQYAEKAAYNSFGGTQKKYIPDTLPVTYSGTQYDFRSPIDMNGYDADVYFGTSYWQDSDYPPDRIVTLYTNNGGLYQAGYAVGYLPIGLGDPSVRKDNTATALNLYKSKKYYPRLIDSTTIVAYTALQSVCYRKPVLDVQNIHMDCYFVPYGDKCYLFVDYLATGEDRIKIPSEYIGKPMSVLHSTSGITVYGTVATNEVRIRCTSVSPNACAVIQIG